MSSPSCWCWGFAEAAPDNRTRKASRGKNAQQKKLELVRHSHIITVFVRNSNQLQSPLEVLYVLVLQKLTRKRMLLARRSLGALCSYPTQWSVAISSAAIYTYLFATWQSDKRYLGTYLPTYTAHFCDHVSRTYVPTRGSCCTTRTLVSLVPRSWK